MSNGTDSPSAHIYGEKRFLTFGSRDVIVGRINGISDHETIESWIKYERENHGRGWVFKHLNERAKELSEDAD